MRWVLGLVVAAAIGAAVFFLVHSDDSTKKVDATSEKATPVVAKRPVEPPPPAAEVTDQQEQAERALIEEFARDQKLTTAETDKLLASLKAMQDGRRQLFADLKSKKISIEDLSARLREMRSTMNKNFENDLGKARSDQLIERMRIAHGGEEKSAK